MAGRASVQHLGSAHPGGGRRTPELEGPAGTPGGCRVSAGGSAPPEHPVGRGEPLLLKLCLRE